MRKGKVLDSETILQERIEKGFKRDFGAKGGEIGDDCFTAGSVKRKEGCFSIVKCSNLQSIEIGEKSFCDYYSFNLGQLPSLRSIHFKARSFTLTPAFELKGKQLCF